MATMRPIVRPPTRSKPPGASFRQTGAVAGPPHPPSIPSSGGAPLSGQAIAANHPNWYGPPAAQAAVRANTPPTPPAAPPQYSAPPDLSGDKWQAYLTPDQLAALRTAGTNTGSQITGIQRQETDAQANYGQQMGDYQYAHDVATSNANDAAAGRGMFLSSARANDLTDINRTLLERQTSATANLNTLIFNATNAIGALNTNYGTTVLQAQGLAAQQVPAPTLITPTPPPAAPPAPAAPAASPQRPPVPTAPPRPQGRTTVSPRPQRPGARTPSFGSQPEWGWRPGRR